MDGSDFHKIFQSAANRGPGKRQIKVVPTEEIAALGAAAGGDDEENDKDWDGKSGSSDGSSGSSDESSSDDSDSDEDSSGDESDGEDSNSGNAEGDLSNMPSSSGVQATDFGEGTDGFAVGSLCCLCLNFRDLPGESVDEVVQCDKCGLAVHEACYGVTDSESVHSGGSSDTTEPWFCEPCLFGVTGKITCELCPSTTGAFKRSDTGRWIHLLCGLYTHGVTFADNEALIGISTFELKYDNFGAKACILCTDKCVARSGVCLKCDAGLCKSYFHVTCAQARGLLIDTGSAESNDAADPYYALCMAHSEHAAMRRKRKRYALLDRQLKEMKARYELKELTPRELEKLKEKRQQYERRMKRLEVWIPHHEQKWQRLLPTSAEFLRKMQIKCEATVGTSKSEYENEFKASITSDTCRKIQMPAAFSAEFVTYYKEREKTLPEVSKRVAFLKKNLDEKKKGQASLQLRFNKLQTDCAAAHDAVRQKHELLRSLHSTLKDMGVRSLKPLESLSPGGLKKRDSTFPADSVSPRSDDSKPVASTMTMHRCGECDKDTNQHLMALCDTCRKLYHIGCLDPPLSKLPKKTKDYGWECSNCFQGDSDEDEEEEEPVDVSAPRQLRVATKPTNRFNPEHEKCEKTVKVKPISHTSKKLNSGPSPRSTSRSPAKRNTNSLLSSHNSSVSSIERSRKSDSLQSTAKSYDASVNRSPVLRKPMAHGGSSSPHPPPGTLPPPPPLRATPTPSDSSVGSRSRSASLLSGTAAIRKRDEIFAQQRGYQVHSGKSHSTPIPIEKPTVAVKPTSRGGRPRKSAGSSPVKSERPHPQSSAAVGVSVVAELEPVVEHDLALVSKLQNFLAGKPGRPRKSESAENPAKRLRVDGGESVEVGERQEYDTPPAVGGSVEVSTTNKSRRRRPYTRMQYPKEKLSLAVNAVMQGVMSAKKASVYYGVPRSTILRRIQVSGEKPKPFRVKIETGSFMNGLQDADSQDDVSSSWDDGEDLDAQQLIRVEDLDL